jgi:hypothetical protein
VRRRVLTLLGIALVASTAVVITLSRTSARDDAAPVRISAAGLSLDLPAGWQRTAAPNPRFDWLSGTLGAAASDGTHRALVTGLIREPGAGQRGLRALLPQGASSETVRVGRFEASRYSHLQLGAGLTGTAYVIDTTGESMALICRGPAGTANGVARDCAQAASTAALSGERPVSPAVAARRPVLVREAVQQLAAQRLAARRRIAAAVVADDQAKAVRGLEAIYLHAAGRIDLSGAYGTRTENLSAALHAASAGYGDLAESIAASDQRAYDAARAAVLEAETQVWGKSAAN